MKLSIRVKFIGVAVSGLMLLSVSQPALADQPVSGITSTEYNEGADKAAPFYNPLAVSNIKLTLPDASFNELNNNPGTTVYQHAAVTITTADGVVTNFADIGVRLKGQATRVNLYGKAPLKLKFDQFVPGQKFMGLTRMTLNSMVQDPSYVHEDMTYRIYRAMGVVAPRTTYSWVTLNGQDFGLYMNIETVDSQMLKRWTTPKHLYSSNCYGADMTPWQSGCYDTNYGDADRTDLNSAVAVSNLDGADWWAAVNQVANMTEVINLMATDIFTSNWDGYTDVVQNNYYIVFDNTGKLSLIPWGEDGTFPMDPSAQLDWLGQGPAFRNWSNSRSVMLRKCVAYDPCKALLIQAEVAAKNTVARLDMVGQKNKIAAVINEAYIAHENRPTFAYLPGVISWQNWLDTFFDQRTASLTTFLLTQPPVAAAVSLTGTARVGQVLTASATSWDYSAGTSYQWLRDGQPIDGASASSYQLLATDATHAIAVRVSATKPGFVSADATTNAVTISPAVAAPAASLSGDASVNGTLTASPTTGGDTQVTYQWLRAGKVIAGATASSYSPSISDYLKPISVRTTVVQVGFKTTITTSSAKIVQAGTFASPVISISGSSIIGQTLSATGSIDLGIKASWQWLRDGAAITGATRVSYLLRADDVGHKLSLRATFTRVAFNAASSTTAAVDVAPGTQVKLPTVTISGLARVGRTLSGIAGSWDSGAKQTYQWLRNGTAIVGETARTHKLVAADLGATLIFAVISKKPGYLDAAEQSLPTTVVTN
jgi:hypothetical protein